MNNTTYTANENCFLIDGEVCAGNRTGLFHEGKEQIEFTHSTKVSEDYILLPRDKFVKPKDVEKLAVKECDERGIKDYGSDYDIFISGFVSGYNANPNEFTIDHLKTAWAYGVEASGTFQDLIKIIIPLSLPANLEINEQGEIVNVIW